MLILGPWLSRLLITLLLLSLAACAPLTARNPSFDLSSSEAKTALRTMRENPLELQRPVLYIGGFLDPGFAEWLTVPFYQRFFTNKSFIAGQSFTLFDTFDSCRAKVIAKVSESWPSDDPTQTVPVDVVAFSMGGLIARYAAMPTTVDAGLPRLNIVRLFTIATPHRGADLAALGSLTALARDMRADSAFLQKLDTEWSASDYPLISYVRLTDWIVGAPNTSIVGSKPWWVSARPFEMAHVQAPLDARIRADILRQLRYEQPWTTTPPTPLP